jgi:Autographiviridae endonuclease VII
VGEYDLNMKCCFKCKQEKPLSAFSPTSSYQGEKCYRADCKACNAAAARKRREDPSKREREKASLQKWRKNNPEKVKAQRRKRNYGITQEQFDALIASQQNACAICRVGFSQSKINCPHVDHNHFTGKVRGLLCHNCNALLGHSKEDQNRLSAAIEYLQRFSVVLSRKSAH